MSLVSADPIDPAALLDEFTRAAGGAGAVASFTGLVRGEDGVRELWLDHHPRLTEQALAEIAEDARLRFEVASVRIVHRVGAVPAGAPIVFVAAAARHRRAAFEAVDYMMDRLKTDAPFWKREDRPDGPRWIEARADDYADRARWDDAR
jgi:molybdopterin synthase catalytic subunit